MQVVGAQSVWFAVCVQIKPLSQDKLARSLDDEFDEQAMEEGGFTGLQSLWDGMAVRMGTWKAGMGEKEEDEEMEDGLPPVHQGQGGCTIDQH